jgi:hypothetical protein
MQHRYPHRPGQGEGRDPHVSRTHEWERGETGDWGVLATPAAFPGSSAAANVGF